MKFLTAAALAAVASAACPNQCSGHGTCTKSDICVCFDRWDGADCSLRKCPEDRAWASASGAEVHAYAECSGQGVCNRASGECECFDGFTGRACARSACPNDCSGRGVCKLLSEVQTAIPYDASNWDAKRIQTCECDAGYFGSDCSLRRCATGDDPLTLCTSDQFNHIQEVRMTLGSLTKYDGKALAETAIAATDNQMAIFNPAGHYASNGGVAAGQLRISYTDSWGGVYTGHPVDVPFTSASDASAAQSLELALETLPNRKVNDVFVESKATNILQADGSLNNAYVPQRAWTVTFLGDKTNSNNVGLQMPLQCDSAYSCTEDGCQPKVTMPFLYRYASTPAAAAGAATATVSSYTGALDAAGNFAGAIDAYKYIKLNAASQPQLPLGIPVDTEATRVGTTSFNRYDIRVLVNVQDGSQTDGVNNGVDNYYTKVIFGHTNITATTETSTGTAAGTGVWSAATLDQPQKVSLNGYTYNGPIPAAFTKVPVPGAPGVFIDFPARDMVSDTKGQHFEILVKLPHCTVTPVTSTGPVVHDLTTFGTSKAQIDANVENIECSGRGQCNRKSGQCECYEGYYGLACSRQTTLV